MSEVSVLGGEGVYLREEGSQEPTLLVCRGSMWLALRQEAQVRVSIPCPFDHQQSSNIFNQSTLLQQALPQARRVRGRWNLRFPLSPDLWQDPKVVRTLVHRSLPCPVS